MSTGPFQDILLHATTDTIYFPDEVNISYHGTSMVVESKYDCEFSNSDNFVHMLTMLPVYLRKGD